MIFFLIKSIFHQDIQQILIKKGVSSVNDYY